MNLVQLFGWIGAFFYAFCAIPQVLLCIKKGSATGLSRGYVFLALFASITSFIYAFHRQDTILISNYIFNIFIWLILLRYLFFPRKDIKKQP